MPTLFPTSIDSFSTKIDGSSDVLAADTNNLQDSVAALQTKVGTNGSAVATSLDRRIALLEAIAAQVLGVGQTWQNLIASRVDNTSYQNTTGKAIMVNVSQDDLSGTNRMYAYVSTNNSTWILVETSMSSSASRGNVGFVVPSGHYYRVDTSTPIMSWAELR